MSGQVRDRRFEERDERADFHPENDLVRWIRKGWDAIRPHLTTILAVVVALLALWGYFAWRRHSTAVARSAAWTDFFAEDYETVISKHQDTEAARYARMRIAEKAIQEGKTQILSKRSDALKSFEKAEVQLDALISDPGAPAELRRTAQLLKAVALEYSGAPDKAKGEYSKLVAQYRDTEEARFAEGRAKELSKKSAVDFYRQLANFKPGDRPPLPPSAKEPGGLDDLLRGLGGSNPNLIPSPAPFKGPEKKAETSTEKKDSIPSPPPAKKTPDAPPGKELPKDDKQPAKEAAKTPPGKPAEPPKK
jgi:hypothetical protein